jgi:hypothetical protein
MRVCPTCGGKIAERKWESHNASHERMRKIALVKSEQEMHIAQKDSKVEPEPSLVNCIVSEIRGQYLSLVGVNPQKSNVVKMMFEDVPNDVIEGLKQARDNEQFVDFQVGTNWGKFVVKRGTTTSPLGYKEGGSILIKAGTLQLSLIKIEIPSKHLHKYVRLTAPTVQGAIRKQCKVCGFVPRYETL